MPLVGGSGSGGEMRANILMTVGIQAASLQKSFNDINKLKQEIGNIIYPGGQSAGREKTIDKAILDTYGLTPNSPGVRNVLRQNRMVYRTILDNMYAGLNDPKLQGALVEKINKQADAIDKKITQKNLDRFKARQRDGMSWMRNAVLQGATEDQNKIASLNSSRQQQKLLTSTLLQDAQEEQKRLLRESGTQEKGGILRNRGLLLGAVAGAGINDKYDRAAQKANQAEMVASSREIDRLNKTMKTHEQTTNGVNGAWLRFRHIGIWHVISSVRNAFLLLTFSTAALVGIFYKAIEASKTYENALIGLSSVAMHTGQSTSAAKDAARDLAKDGLMTVSEAARGLKNLLATGFSLPESIKLMKGFKDSASFARQGSLGFGESIIGATEGLKNNNMMLLDNAGLTKNMSVILKEIGVSQEEYGRMATDSAVRTKVLGGLLKELALFGGDAARMLGTYSGSVAKLEASNTLLQIQMGNMLKPALMALYNIFTEIIQIFQKFYASMQDQATAQFVNTLKGIGNTVEILIKGFTTLYSVANDVFKMGGSSLAGGIPALATIFLGKTLISAPIKEKLVASRQAGTSSIAAFTEAAKWQAMPSMSGPKFAEAEAGLAAYLKQAKGLEKANIAAMFSQTQFNSEFKKVQASLSGGSTQLGNFAKAMNLLLHPIESVKMGMKSMAFTVNVLKTALLSFLGTLALQMGIFLALNFIFGIFARHSEKVQEAIQKTTEENEKYRQTQAEGIQQTIATIQTELELIKTYGYTAGSLEKRIELETKVLQLTAARENLNKSFTGGGASVKFTSEGLMSGNQTIPFSNRAGLRGTLATLQQLQKEQFAKEKFYIGGKIGSKEQIQKAYGLFSNEQYSQLEDTIQEIYKYIGEIDKITKGDGIKKYFSIPDAVSNEWYSMLSAAEDAQDVLGKKGINLINTQNIIDAKNAELKAREDTRKEFMKDPNAAMILGSLTKDLLPQQTQEQQDMMEKIAEAGNNAYYTTLKKGKTNVDKLFIDYRETLMKLQHELETIGLTPAAKAQKDAYFAAMMEGKDATQSNAEAQLAYNIAINQGNQGISDQIRQLQEKNDILRSGLTQEEADANVAYGEAIRNNLNPALAQQHRQLTLINSELEKYNKYKDDKALEKADKDYQRGLEKRAKVGTSGWSLPILNTEQSALEKQKTTLEAQLDIAGEFLKTQSAIAITWAEMGPNLPGADVQVQMDKLQKQLDEIEKKLGIVKDAKDKAFDFKKTLEDVQSKAISQFIDDLANIGTTLGDVWYDIPKKVREATREADTLLRSNEITQLEHTRRIQQIEHQSLLARQAAWVKFADSVTLQIGRMIIQEIMLAKVRSVLEANKGLSFLGLLGAGLGVALPFLLPLAALSFASTALLGNNQGGDIGSFNQQSGSAANANRSASASVQAPVQNLTIIPSLYITADHDVYIGSGSIEEFSGIIKENMVGMMNDAIVTGEIQLPQSR